ncbi:hypothetical protein GCM10025789_20940 [Tessaracoccus lubricantis]|uniref:Replication protein n=2 Tax=Tessaracoccus lubricantis TaxID=545543 RepID=A0ABP9FH58_9ACTN
MTIAPGSDQADKPPGSVSRPGHSEAVNRLVSTRAQIIALMRDPRLPPLAKQVGSLLWAITETWERGETKTLTYQQLAEQIVWESRDGVVQTASAEGVRKAVKALREAGYVAVASVQHPGNGKPSSMQCIPRATSHALTHDESGPFRVWTNGTFSQSAGSWEPGVSPSYDEVPVPRNRESESGGSGEPGVGKVPVPGNRPSKETSWKSTSLDEDDQLTPPPRGDAADAAALESVDWDSLTTAGDVVELLSQALTTHGQAEVRKRAKRREIERGVGTLMAKGWDMPRVLAGVGLWAGDRELRNADVLDEIASRLIRTQLASPARLVLHQPLDLLRQSFALGEEVRRERENAA